MQKVRRASKPPRLIIAFGPFAAEFAQEILGRGLADMVVSHDPEFVIPLIVEQGATAGALAAIPNVYYKHEGSVVYTRKHSFPDLDAIPFISPYLYNHKHPLAFIMSSRGCQYHCVYCDRNALWGGGVRQRSIDSVLKELKELVGTNRVQKFEFLDEDLAADPKYLIALCEGIRRMKGEFSWGCSACVDSVNKELLLLLGRSRCREVYFGVESASPNVLRKIGKMYGREDILNAVRWAQEAGLMPEVMLTIGNPSETDADRDLTLSALTDMGPDINIRTNRLVILPGTAFFRKALRQGWFTKEHFFEDEGIIFYDEKRYAQESRNP
jgi:radical SAM superfamily enzyme YgiQ (UPF0313 family)